MRTVILIATRITLRKFRRASYSAKKNVLRKKHYLIDIQIGARNDFFLLKSFIRLMYIVFLRVWHCSACSSMEQSIFDITLDGSFQHFFFICALFVHSLFKFNNVNECVWYDWCGFYPFHASQSWIWLQYLNYHIRGNIFVIYLIAIKNKIDQYDDGEKTYSNIEVHIHVHTTITK